MGCVERCTMPDDISFEPGWSPAAELRVTDAAAVAILWHPAQRLHLRPFLGRASALGEAAQLLGLKKPAMSYWVKRLLAAGLIRPSGQARVGRQRVPTYRCVADRLRVSLKDAPLASYESVFEDSSARWQPATLHALARAVARQAPALDLTIYVDGPGGLGTTLLPRAGEVPRDDFVYYWGRLWLTPAERDALRNELDALWDRWSALSNADDKPCATLVHLVHVAES
jgi:DNA-binding transcriptional ArsR family regulator